MVNENQYTDDNYYVEIFIKTNKKYYLIEN